MFVLRGQRAVQLHNKMFKHHSSPSKFVEMVMLLTCIQQVKMGQDSVVTVATCYKKNSLGIESQGGNFSTSIQNGSLSQGTADSV